MQQALSAQIFLRRKTFNLCNINRLEYGRFCALLPPLFLQLPRTNASHYFLTSRLTYILPALLQIKGSPWKPEFTLACRLCQQLDISCASNKRHTWYSCTYSFPEIENPNIILIRELHRLSGQHGRQFKNYRHLFTAWLPHLRSRIWTAKQLMH